MTKADFLKKVEKIVNELSENYDEKIVEKVLGDFDLSGFDEELGDKCLDLELEEDCEDEE